MSPARDHILIPRTRAATAASNHAAVQDIRIRALLLLLLGCVLSPVAEQGMVSVSVKVAPLLLLTARLGLQGQGRAGQAHRVDKRQQQHSRGAGWSVALTAACCCIITTHQASDHSCCGTWCCCE
jgi:hypothetical protein